MILKHKSCQIRYRKVGVGDVVEASGHHVAIVPVGVRIPAAATEKVDPCTEGAPIVKHDLSRRPAILKLTQTCRKINK